MSFNTWTSYKYDNGYFVEERLANGKHYMFGPFKTTKDQDLFLKHRQEIASDKPKPKLTA